jgi:hypothetical protein
LFNNQSPMKPLAWVTVSESLNPHFHVRCFLSLL